MASTPRVKPEDWIGNHVHQYLIQSVKSIVYPSRTTKFFNCSCSCGKIFQAKATTVMAGDIQSCGCVPNKMISKVKTPRQRLRDVWHGMKERCTNAKHDSYRYYGAKGITYSLEWQDFDLFLADMGSTYEEKLQLDRIDNKGNYCKENCRWITSQQNNQKQVKDTSSSTSKYTGVGLEKKTDRWIAYIQDNGRQNHLGTFDTELEAARAYDTRCLELRGEFAQLNRDLFPQDFQPTLTVTQGTPDQLQQAA